MPQLHRKLLTSHDLADMRGIEVFNCGTGVLYRVCSEGGGICRITPDLIKALDYADQMRPERQIRPR